MSALVISEGFLCAVITGSIDALRWPLTEQQDSLPWPCTAPRTSSAEADMKRQFGRLKPLWLEVAAQLVKIRGRGKA
jgi:hypothetical protein